MNYSKLLLVLNIALFCGINLYSQITFEEITNTPFVGVKDGSVSISDIDLDGDVDIFITGRDDSFTAYSKLYLNDGNGLFLESVLNVFPSVKNSSSQFFDMDGDGDEDLIYSGINSAGTQLYLGLYSNNGNSLFTEVSSTNLPANSGEIEVADVDNDSDLDLFMTFGQNQESKIFLNDGTGQFTESNLNSLIAVDLGSSAFADIDQDNDLDLLITGLTSALGNGSEAISYLYLNDGNGAFTLQSSSAIVGVYYSSVSFGDYDSDSDQDLLISGVGINGIPPSTRLYENDGFGNYSEVSGVNLQDFAAGDLGFEDFDNDGDFDIFMATSIFPSWQSFLYEQNDLGQWIEVSASTIEGVTLGEYEALDFDNDGDLDILLTGDNGLNPVSILYQNTSPIVIQGCTLPAACNYDSQAQTDDGSCILPDGCTDVTAYNYSSEASCDDDSCIYYTDLLGDCVIWDAAQELFVSDPECTSSCIGDLNGDSNVTAGDLTLFLSVFGESCEE